MIIILSTLFVNATILFSFLYIGSLIFRNENLLVSRNIKIKLLLGVLCGIGGCILIYYSVNVSNKVFMDFRIIALIISSIYGGPISAILTTFIIVLFRIGYYGVSKYAIVMSVSLIVLFLIYMLITSTNWNIRKKYYFMSIYNVVYVIICYSILLANDAMLLVTLSSFTISTILVCIAVYYILDHITKTNELFRRLKFESTKDFLTGINNVREFDSLLNNAEITAIEKNESLSILLIDIDYFKKINDTYGHPSGDLVLKQLSIILINCCRSFDIVSRNGGEEFSMILLDCDYNYAYIIAEKIRETVEESIFIIENYLEIHITVSIGVGSYPHTTVEINNLLSTADNALYLAKRSGRNKVC